MSQSLGQEARHIRSHAPTHRHLLSRWADAIGIWLNRRRGWQELRSLDDRLLEDVGISREDALWKAGKPFWRA